MKKRLTPWATFGAILLRGDFCHFKQPAQRPLSGFFYCPDPCLISPQNPAEDLAAISWCAMDLAIALPTRQIQRSVRLPIRREAAVNHAAMARHGTA